MGILTREGIPSRESGEKVCCFWQGNWNQTFPSVSLSFLLTSVLGTFTSQLHNILKIGLLYNQKMGQRTKQTLLQGRHTDG